MLVAYLLTENLTAIEWGPRKTWLIAMASGGAGSICGTMSGMLFNPRLAGYWVWFFLGLVLAGFAPIVQFLLQNGASVKDAAVNDAQALRFGNLQRFALQQ